MTYFSYKMEHDYGLAPNPFGAYCTLAVCKSSIRNNRRLKIDDWIIGTGSVELKTLHKLIFIMQVGEKLTFNQYWADPRFQYKRPILNGSLLQLYGDNFYHQNPTTEEWVQENSAHSLEGGLLNIDQLQRDTGGQFVLISQNFYYFGDQSVQIQDKHLPICNEGRDMKSPSIPIDIADDFIRWVQRNFTQGIHGDPISWSKYKLKKIDYESV